MGRIDHEIKNEADIPMTGLSAYIADLAKRHGVAYVKTASGALAEVITRLSGDDLKPDDTEKLVIALRRANVIDGKTMVTLLGRYFGEIRNEGSEAERQLRRQQESGKSSWLLPVDYYERSKSTLQTCRENPELPPRLIDDIMQSIEEGKAGQVTTYKFGKSEP